MTVGDGVVTVGDGDRHPSEPHNQAEGDGGDGDDGVPGTRSSLNGELSGEEIYRLLKAHMRPDLFERRKMLMTLSEARELAAIFALKELAA